MTRLSAQGSGSTAIEIGMHKGEQEKNSESEHKDSMGIKRKVRSLVTKSTDGLAYLPAIGFMYSYGATSFASAFNIASNGIYGAVSVATTGTAITLAGVTTAGIASGMGAAVTTGIAAGIGASLGAGIGGASCALIIAEAGKITAAGVKSYCATSVLSYTVAGAASFATPVAVTLASAPLAKKAGRCIYDMLFQNRQVTLTKAPTQLSESQPNQSAYPINNLD